MREVTEVVDAYYSPEMIDRWLRQWPLLVALAETPTTARHHLTSEHRHDDDRPCARGPRIGKSGRPADHLQYATVKADLENAASRLPFGDLGKMAILNRMQTGASIRDVALLLRCRRDTLRAAYRTACELMARDLGWEPEVVEPERRSGYRQLLDVLRMPAQDMLSTSTSAVGV